MIWWAKYHKSFFSEVSEFPVYTCHSFNLYVDILKACKSFWHVKQSNYILVTVLILLSTSKLFLMYYFKKIRWFWDFPLQFAFKVTNYSATDTMNVLLVWKTLAPSSVLNSAEAVRKSTKCTLSTNIFINVRRRQTETFGLCSFWK